MIAGVPKVKTSALTIETITMRAGRTTTFVPRIATTSAPITKKTFGNGASIPIGVILSAPANISPLECA